MKKIKVIKIIDGKIIEGLVGAIKSRIAYEIRFNIVKYFPKYADYIVSKRKGKCNKCGECCANSECEFLINNKCSIYNQRKEKGFINCIYAPFPLDLKINSLYKKCGFYYGKRKIRRIDKYGITNNF